MKTPTEWNHEPATLDWVLSALDNHMDEMQDGVEIIGSEETNDYGDKGSIYINTPDGRRFSIELYELR